MPWPWPHARNARIAQKELQHTINLHPSYFGPQTEVYLRNKLHADVEGTCSGRVGYIIAVLGVRRLLHARGSAHDVRG